MKGSGIWDRFEGLGEIMIRKGLQAKVLGVSEGALQYCDGKK